MVPTEAIACPANSAPEILDHLLIGIIIVDVAGCITYANEVACRLLDTSNEEIIGKTTLDAHWKKVDEWGMPYPEDQLPLSIALQEQRSVTGVECGLQLTEEVRWLSVHAAPLHNELGELTGAVANFFDVTDKKNTEKKSLQREHRLSSIANSQTSYLVRADMEGQFTYVNDAFLAKYDYKEEEVLGRPFSLITDPNDVEPCITVANDCVKSPGESRAIEIRGVNKQRDYFWTEWEFVGIADESGRVTEIQAVGRDISNEKRTEGLLAETSQMAHVGGWELTSLTQNVSWTDETYRIHDLAPDSPVTLRKSIRFYHPDHQPIIKRAIKKLIADGESFDLELKIITEKGREVWVRTQGQREAPHGNFIRIYGVIQDITTIRKSEEKLKESEWTLKSVFNNTSDALLIIDNNNKIINCNTSAVRIFEAENKEAIIGKMGSDLQKKKFSKAKMEKIRQKISKKGLWTGEIEYVTAQERSFWGDLAITTFGEAKYAVVRVTDITERKMAEERMISNNEKLKKINQELDRFVYSASHDLRAPLTSIVGLINLSKLEDASPTIAEYLGLMKKSADKLDSFIQDLTNFSRNARTEIKRDLVDFQDMIDTIFEQHKFMDGSKEADMQADIEQAFDFYSDNSRLQVVFSNIISNAVKYNNSQAEKALVDISVRVTAERASIRISDNGMGIGQEHLERIFEMFYRATDERQGSGLGLYIVKETIEKLNGEVQVTSELGTGTTFTFEIPNMTPEEK